MDKIKFIFKINDQESALNCYTFLESYDTKSRNYRKFADGGDFLKYENLKIYLQRDEEVFEKYADEEAALYEQMNKEHEEKYKKKIEEEN